MPKVKQYIYKVWVEIERVEVDKTGKEVGDHERGEIFGLDPVKVGNTDSLAIAEDIQARLVKEGGYLI